MAKYQENSWEELKSELKVRFAEVNYPHHAFTMLHKLRQVKHESVQVYAERLYALANDVLTKVDNTVVESQLVGFFTYGLYMRFSIREGHKRKSKNISGCSKSALAEKNCKRDFN